MRTFEAFPEEATCPICKTNNSGQCTLIPIDGTQDGNIMEAQPVHVTCMMDTQFFYAKELGLIYIKV